MKDATYNGWVNYPTWNVNLWLDEYGCNADLHRMARKADSEYNLAGQIEAYASELMLGEEDETAGAKSDLLTWAWGMVDWNEIAERYWNDRNLAPHERDEEYDDE